MCADAFWINDAHEPPLRLWQEILHCPEKLADHYARHWHAQIGRERAYHDQIRQRFNAGLIRPIFSTCWRGVPGPPFATTPAGNSTTPSNPTARGASCGDAAAPCADSRLLGKWTIPTTGNYASVLAARTSATRHQYQRD